MRGFLAAGRSPRHSFLSSAHTAGASRQSLSTKHQRCRVSDLSTLHFFYLISSNPTCWRGLSYLNAACVRRLHTHTRSRGEKGRKNAIVLFPPLSSSNTEIICKEIIGLARAGLLHTNFVRLTSRGQCTMWPLARALEFILFDWKDSV